ncbi:anthranilate synthase component I [Sporolactobacillus sp. THM19-2]|uniref:anthranilate synthase component I n=1 Tax=Sporolactobacillus sp. THM19-2 TaxID=2511171 RepID=UPI00102069EC|nr:anthranilate synthase component I [Sporolactobacillus sp. THM19-2]RYL94202.1 anthranilate synthase component I [Sporolactobacillus sp. THM19-2]
MNFFSREDHKQKTVVYSAGAGLEITRTQIPVSADQSLLNLIDALDEHKGALYSSTYHFPGRYSRWDVGFLNPPIELTAKKDTFVIRSLNARGRLILTYLENNLSSPAFSIEKQDPDCLSGTIMKSRAQTILKEENRTRQSSLFTLLRQIQSLFRTDDDFLGLYGAFGFDLILQFESFPLAKGRDPGQNDLQLYLPDQLIVADREKNEAFRISYEFRVGGRTTENLAREGKTFPFHPDGAKAQSADADRKGDYAAMVRKARQAFKRGDLFEVVPSRLLVQPCQSRPSEVFRRLQKINPSPYGFLIHLNQGEFLVGCSPEMFVRVDGATVETSPISGTIRRRGSVIEDAEQIKTLLGSPKEESELTMCTDVDRNDKSRICVPGSVEVVGRRQIEAYSHLFHTVDHIKGLIRPEFDAIDAFISHMWAVTITGAPKLEAIKWIEHHEKTPRGWYGGAVGWIGFDGRMNTGLALRCLSLQKGIARIRVGATLLYDSDPEREEQETLTKAAALLEALKPQGEPAGPVIKEKKKVPGRNLHLLFVDHEDSFVHTLSGYFQYLGADVTVLRSSAARRMIKAGGEPIDLVVLSPGPGRPERYHMDETIRLCLERRLPLFGICLGLQGLVSYFGGSLDLLPAPVHGKPSAIITAPHSMLFRGIPHTFTAGRYHSVHARVVSDPLKVTAETEDGIVMAVEHRSLPVAAVQFHPESMMTMGGNVGMKILENVIRMVSAQPV